MVDFLDAMIDGWVNQIVMVIGQMPWLGPLLALIAGVLAAFTPCCLSSIPLIVGYISGLGEKTTKRAFLTGILAGIFASPCSTPILVALLAIIAGDGRFFWGILLMLCYAAGHSVLVLIAGTSVGFVQRLKGSAHYERFSFWSEKILCALIFAVGIDMFWLAL